ncbi:hypothetical protein D3C86_1898790 [compost metagenome]
MCDQVEPLNLGREFDTSFVRPFVDRLGLFDQAVDALGSLEVTRRLDLVNRLHDVQSVAQWVAHDIAGRDYRPVGRDDVPEIVREFEVVWVE